MPDSKYEGCGEIGSIRAIFLSQFHPVQGPMIRCQYPDDFLSKDTFDSLSSFIIPKNELQEHNITVNCLGYKISGYPTYLHDKKYKRNYLLFNLCIVSYPWSRTVQFEPIVRKLSQFFVNLEKERELLSKTEDHDSEEIIVNMLEQVYNDLNTMSKCEVECGQNSLQLCVTNTGEDPPQVMTHDVPLLTMAMVTRFCCDQWDLTTTQILPHIDGFNHIAKIASLADVGTSLVRACVQNLVYHGVVGLSSIFLYSNVYTVTPHLALLRSDKQLRQDLMNNIARKDAVKQPTFRDVYTFLSSFTYGTTVRDLCQRLSPIKSGFDESRLVQYCVMKGVLRRVDKYPVWSGDGDTSPGHSATDTRLMSLMTGEHNTDQICVTLNMSAAALDKKIDDDASVVVIWK